MNQTKQQEGGFRRILIIKMSSLGDVIHALPTLYALRQGCPEARITWAVHPEFDGLLPGKPWLDEIYHVDRKRIKEFSYWKTLRKELGSRHFDLSVDLQMLAKSALVAALAGAEKKVGYWEAREGSWLVSRPLAGPHKEGHIIERLLDVSRALGCRPDRIAFPVREHSAETEQVRRLLHESGVTGPYAVCVPGTRGAGKMWPAGCWTAFLKELARRRIFAVIAGSPGEKELGRRIAEDADSPYAVDLTGKTSLLQLTALEEGASLHLSADTGPLHIANAVRTPMIALFGPTSPDRSGPYGGGRSVVLRAPAGENGTVSMTSITPERVLETFLRIWDPAGRS